MTIGSLDSPFLGDQLIYMVPKIPSLVSPTWPCLLKELARHDKVAKGQGSI